MEQSRLWRVYLARVLYTGLLQPQPTLLPRPRPPPSSTATIRRTLVLLRRELYPTRPWLDGKIRARRFSSRCSPTNLTTLRTDTIIMPTLMAIRHIPIHLMHTHILAHCLGQLRSRVRLPTLLLLRLGNVHSTRRCTTVRTSSSIRTRPA